MKTDLIIIGSGPGGYRAAEYAAQQGLKVVIIEAKEVGGTCLNCGCIPTKTLCKNAEILENLKEADLFGLTKLQYDIDFPKIMERKQKVVETLRAGIETLLSCPCITLVKGQASFIDAHTVKVGDEEYNADNIMIATGSSAKMPPIKGINLPHVITSTELLDVQAVPKRLCIVGAGVIGLEFASIFNSFGSEVTVVEFLKECLPVFDTDVAKRLRQAIAKRGVNFFMQSGVKEITPEKVIFERKGKIEEVEADLVLIATGRKPNIEGLNLEAVGVECSAQGIVTDEHLRTNIEGIYAIGDVNARCMLAHAATFQGIHAINHMINKTDAIQLDIMPSAIFTNPEAAGVGLTENQCKEQGIAYTCKKGYYRANGKALAMNEGDGLVKLMADENGKIIGCYVLGAHAADLVQEISSLMTLGTTVKQLADMVHTHPTLEEILQEVSMQF